MAPGREQPEVGGVAPPCTSAVAGEEAGHGELLGSSVMVLNAYDSDTGGGHVPSLGSAAGRWQLEDITYVIVIGRTCSCHTRALARLRPCGRPGRGVSPTTRSGRAARASAGLPTADPTNTGTSCRARSSPSRTVHHQTGDIVEHRVTGDQTHVECYGRRRDPAVGLMDFLAQGMPSR